MAPPALPIRGRGRLGEASALAPTLREEHMQFIAPSKIQNRFLRALPGKLLDELLPELQPVPLPVKQVLHRPGDHLDFAYFPETGMISVVVDLEDGGTIEVGTIGNEGVAPSSLVLGGEVARSEAMVQIGLYGCQRER